MSTKTKAAAKPKTGTNGAHNAELLRLRELHVARVRAGYGKFAVMGGGTVDEFLKERHEEAKREEAKGARKAAPAKARKTA